MTSDESRLQHLEEQFHSLDVRQTSLETYIKLYASKTDEQMRLQREEMREFKAETKAHFAKLDEKMDGLSAQMHNLAMGFSAGVGAILVAMFVALFLAR